MLSIEWLILISVWIICFVSVWFIRRENRAKASFIFLLTQCLTWITGLIVVEMGWIEYPIRALAKANSTSLTFEYLMLPLTTTFFTLYFPNDSRLSKKINFYIAFASAMTGLEVLFEKYTQLVKYHSWTWYWTWVTVMLTFYTMKCVYKWFYNIKGIFYI